MSTVDIIKQSSKIWDMRRSLDWLLMISLAALLLAAGCASMPSGYPPPPHTVTLSRARYHNLTMLELLGWAARKRSLRLGAGAGGRPGLVGSRGGAVMVRPG